MFTIYNEDEDRYQLVEEPDAAAEYTYADYLQWKFKERLELVKGRILKMSPAPNLEHQQVSVRLTVLLYNFLEKKQCQVFAAPFDVRLPLKGKNKDHEIDTVVQPDICVVCDDNKIDERGCCGAPDLVIEILSPGNSKKEVRIKFELYEEAGVKEYWIINPAEQNLVIYLLNSEGKFANAAMYAPGDIINSHAVEGFTIDVSKIFIK